VDDDRRHEYPDETKACALALIDAGASWSEAAREVGVGKSMVQVWVQRRRAEQHSGPFRAQTVAEPAMERSDAARWSVPRSGAAWLCCAVST
jgi:transposase-like protein